MADTKAKQKSGGGLLLVGLFIFGAYAYSGGGSSSTDGKRGGDDDSCRVTSAPDPRLTPAGLVQGTGVVSCLRPPREVHVTLRLQKLEGGRAVTVFDDDQEISGGQMSANLQTGGPCTEGSWKVVVTAVGTTASGKPVNIKDESEGWTWLDC
ncbi:hypothetical protein [Streptomyces sp. NBC_01304]|uniref:hypothetical protein n=1 Tax=Streptomyces sp. NBC_01304 TaxID=2903818 RepID=UPI002E12346B|nr:hypothetical protein OG430_44655 [Streptomyces sp. NBC_01304]